MDLSKFIVDGVLTPRPATKLLSDLERVLKLNKPQAVIDTFALLTAHGELWQWFDDYIDNCHEIAAVIDFNRYIAGAVIEHKESAEDILIERKEIPTEISPCPEIRTVEQVLASTLGYSSYKKALGVELKGIKLSLNEANQTGIGVVMKGIELAAKYQQSIFPINFRAETAMGDKTISFDSQEEFELFALQFMSARQQFFT